MPIAYTRPSPTTGSPRIAEKSARLPPPHRGGERVGPHDAAAVGAQRRQFARAEAGHHQPAGIGRRRPPQDAGRGIGRLVRPELPPVIGRQRQQPVLDGGDEQPALHHRRRGSGRRAEFAAPAHGALGGIQRDHLRQPVHRIERALIDREAAAHVGAVVVLLPGVEPPHPRCRRRCRTPRPRHRNP